MQTKFDDFIFLKNVTFSNLSASSIRKIKSILVLGYSLVQRNFCNILRTTHVKHFRFSEMLVNISKTKSSGTYLLSFEKQPTWNIAYVL